jgi:hypothetical protein
LQAKGVDTGWVDCALAEAAPRGVQHVRWAHILDLPGVRRGSLTGRRLPPVCGVLVRSGALSLLGLRLTPNRYAVGTPHYLQQRNRRKLTSREPNPHEAIGSLGVAQSLHHEQAEC